MKPRLFFYCQHVLGMGHLVRSREIVRALSDFDVWFLNGGEPVDGFGFPGDVRVVQLPPITSDVEFKAISASEQVKAERRDTLLALLADVKPDIAVLEMYPFGRRKFAFELVPFLEAARDTFVVSSVRDILVSKRDQARHDDQAVRLLNEHFDMVMVHADERFQRLEETFTRAADIRCQVHYTGFVTQPLVPAAKQTNAVPAILASAGGGRVGFELLDTVIRASLLIATQLSHTLDVFTGPYLAQREFDALVEAAAGAPWIRIERFAHDFQQRLVSTDLLVSMAGYNTCMNVLATGVRALVYPFTGNGNEEQTIRARKLAALGSLDVVADLSVSALAAQMIGAVRRPMAGAVRLDLNGAAHTAQLLKGCLAHV